jgi:hypothetical protein
MGHPHSHARYVSKGYSCSGKFASPLDDTAARAVVAVSMCGARFVGGVVGAAGAVVSALTP